MHVPRKVWAWIGILWVVLLPSQAVAQTHSVKPLEMGLIPNLDPRALFQAYQPMRDYVEKAMQRSLLLYTAPDFKDFYFRTLKGEFDIVVTPAHFARAAQQEAGYIPLLQYKKPLKSIVIAPVQGINTLSELRGKRLAVPDPTAIVTILAMRTLEKNGLKPGVDVVLEHHTAHTNAVHSMKQGEVAATVMGSGPYKLMSETLRASTHIVTELGQVPNATFLVHPRVGKATVDQLRMVFMAFAHEDAAGKAFIERYGYEGFKPVTARDLAEMDDYTKWVKRILDAP